MKQCRTWGTMLSNRPTPAAFRSFLYMPKGVLHALSSDIGDQDGVMVSSQVCHQPFLIYCYKLFS